MKVVLVFRIPSMKGENNLNLGYRGRRSVFASFFTATAF